MSNRHRIKFVEHVAFHQGDDADEAFKILYPRWDHEANSAHIGNVSQASLKHTVEHMAQWDYGEPTDQGARRFELPWGASIHTTRFYVLTWSFSYTWISLDRILTKAQVAEQYPELLRGES